LGGKFILKKSFSSSRMVWRRREESQRHISSEAKERWGRGLGKKAASPHLRRKKRKKRIKNSHHLKTVSGKSSEHYCDHADFKGSGVWGRGKILPRFTASAKFNNAPF